MGMPKLNTQPSNDPMAMAYYIPMSKEVVPVGNFQFLGWVGLGSQPDSISLHRSRQVLYLRSRSLG
jgi:hypothetical protein